MTATAPTERALTRNPLWPFQQRVFDAARDQQASMLAVAMGGGKSLTTLALLEHDLRGCAAAAGQPYRVLIVAPKSVTGVWPDQVVQHATSSWTTWAGDVWGQHGERLKAPTVARRAEALVQATTNAARLRRPFMAVVNFEACCLGDLARITLGTPWDAIVIDESHRIKAPAGKASRHIAKVAERVRARGGRVLALTGTPMPHSPLDLWGQYRALDGGARLGTNYHRFCHSFGAGEQIWTQGPAGPMQRTVFKGLRDDRMAEFTRLVAPIMHQVTEDELESHLGLPKAVDVYRTFELGASTRRVYDDLEKHMIARVGDGTVTSANAMVLVLRLAQITSGIAPDAVDGHEILVAPGGRPEKATLLADTLSDLPTDEPVVVFCRFHHDLDQVQAICAEQGRTYGELSGRRRDGITESSRMNPDIDVLGAQIKSGGVGIDLTRARYGVLYTLGFELGDYRQLRKRQDRPGQTRQVVFIHLIAEDTVEQAIYGALRRRQAVVDTVLASLKGATK